MKSALVFVPFQYEMHDFYRKERNMFGHRYRGCLTFIGYVIFNSRRAIQMGFRSHLEYEKIYDIFHKSYLKIAHRELNFLKRNAYVFI